MTKMELSVNNTNKKRLMIKRLIKKIILYSFSFILLLLTPICLMGILGTSVSLKYEVDEARIFVEIDKRRSENEKKNALNEINQHETELKRELFLWKLGSLGFPLLGTMLLFYRKRLIGTNLK